MKKIISISILVFLLWMASIAYSFAAERVIIAVIKSRDTTPYDIAVKGFARVLRDKGIDAYLVKYNIKGSREEGSRIVEEVKAQRPALVLTIGSLATEIAQQSIKDIPIVFSMVLNPVASGLLRSMETSGSNVTGVSMDIPIRHQFEAFKATVPNMKTIGVVYNPQESGVIIREASRVAEEMGLKLMGKEVSLEEDVPSALEELGKRIDVLWAVADSTVFNPQSTQFIILHTLRNRIPFMGLSRSYVEAGALLSLFWDFEDIGRQTGELAAKVLSGEQPSDLPIAVPRRTFLLLNLRVAERIEISIPSEVINRAKEVIR